MGQKVQDMFAYHLVPTVQYTEMARNEKMCGGRVKFCFNPVLGGSNTLLRFGGGSEPQKKQSPRDLVCKQLCKIGLGYI